MNDADTKGSIQFQLPANPTIKKLEPFNSWMVSLELTNDELSALISELYGLQQIRLDSLEVDS